MKPDNKYLSYLSIHSTTKVNYHGDETISASVILPLSDSSFLGILLGQKLDGTAFNDFDKITLLIFFKYLTVLIKLF